MSCLFKGILEVGAGLLNRTGIICEEFGAGGVGEPRTLDGRGNQMLATTTDVLRVGFAKVYVFSRVVLIYLTGLTLTCQAHHGSSFFLDP